MYTEYFRAVIFSVAVAAVIAPTPQTGYAQKNAENGEHVLMGQEAAGDWTTDEPGVRRRITAADMPKPYLSESVRNGPKLVKRPDGALPLVPKGFKVEEFL